MPCDSSFYRTGSFAESTRPQNSSTPVGAVRFPTIFSPDTVFSRGGVTNVWDVYVLQKNVEFRRCDSYIIHSILSKKKTLLIRFFLFATDYAQEVNISLEVVE